MTEARRLFVRNAVSAYGVRGLRAASVLALTPYLFRNLGIGAFGTYSVIFAFASVYSLIEFGFARGLSKVFAELHAEGRRAELERALHAAVIVMGTFGLVTVFLSGAVGELAEGLAAPNLETHFELGMIALGIERLLYSPLAAYVAALGGFQRYDWVNAATAVEIVGGTIATVAAVEFGGGVLGATVATAGAHLAGGLVALYYLRRHDRKLRLWPRGLDRGAARRITGFSSFVLLAESMTFIGQRFDTVVIASIRDAVAAAPFAAAVKLQTGLQSLTLPLVYQLMPMASDLWARGERDVASARTALATRAATQITLPVAAALAFFAPDAVKLWLGDGAPSHTATIVTVLLASQVLTLAAAPAEQVLVGIGKVRVLGLISLVEGIGNLGLSIVLVYKFGAIGAAFGTLFTSGLLSPIKYPLVCRELQCPLGRFLRDTLGRALLSSIPALLAMGLVRATLDEGSLRLAVGATAGIGVAAITGAIQLGPARLQALRRRG